MKQFIDFLQQPAGGNVALPGGQRKEAGHHIVKPPFGGFLLVSFVLWVNGKKLQASVESQAVIILHKPILAPWRTDISLTFYPSTCRTFVIPRSASE